MGNHAARRPLAAPRSRFALEMAEEQRRTLPAASAASAKMQLSMAAVRWQSAGATAGRGSMGDQLMLGEVFR